jgi:bacitracin synthase 1
MIPENWDRIPVGKPCSNMEAFVLDESGQPTVIGRPGTLWMSGTNLMAGYYDGRKNAYLGIESLPNGGPERVFNTGDIVAIGADGNFRFYGRSDRMIKYRGYRIELGEIENVFSRHTKVRFAAAFFLHPPGQQQYIAVVIQFANEYNEHSENCIKAWSAEFLPKYMIPSRVIKIDEVPYTSTGKVDQVKLKQIAMGVLDD